MHQHSRCVLHGKDKRYGRCMVENVEGLRDAEVTFTCSCEVEKGDGHCRTARRQMLGSWRKEEGQNENVLVDQQRRASTVDRPAPIQHV